MERLESYTCYICEQPIQDRDLMQQHRILTGYHFSGNVKKYYESVKICGRQKCVDHLREYQDNMYEALRKDSGHC